MGERGKDPKEKRCGICGKDIYAGEEWAYKRKYHGEKTIWFCSYKCMRAYDATIGEPKKSMEEPEKQPEPPKEPTSRADQAKALAREILAGRSVIAWLKKEGYKNPHEAYSAVRHYAQTKMPELAETLKPLKDLPKAPQAARTGRPRKYPAKVETVEKVPEVVDGKNAPPLKKTGGIREMLEPVPCIAHVTDAELAEAEEPEQYSIFHPKTPGFRYDVKTIETDIGEFSYDKEQHILTFRKKGEALTFGAYEFFLAMNTKEWDQLMTILPKLADLMGVTL